MSFNKNFIIIFFLISIFSFGFLLRQAKAITATEIQDLIRQLQEQILQLQQQLRETEPEAQAWCYTFNFNLKFDERGEEVRFLHTVLEKDGFTISNEEKTSNYFGEYTASAVSGFQMKYRGEILSPWGLKYGTGFVGKTTRMKLNSFYGCAIKIIPEIPEILVEEKPAETPSVQDVPVETEESYIKVLLPNGGEKWYAGHTYRIGWASSNVRAVDIMMYSGNSYNSLHNYYPITTSLDATKGYYSWTVPSNMGFENFSCHKIKIGASYEDIYQVKTQPADVSDSCFTIINEELIPPNIQCLDSDEGKNYHEKGTVKWMSANSGIISYSDYCLSDTYLKELFCLSTSYKASINYYCEYGCQDGVCKTAPVPPEPVVTCTDSDGGANEYSYGKTTEGSLSVFDICEGNSVKEWYCSASGKTHKYIFCANGCSDGVCKKLIGNDATTGVVCADSDNGKDYYSYGNVTHADGNLTSYDICTDGQTLKENYCDNGYYAHELYTCPYGCQNSICIPQPQKFITLTYPNGGEEWFKGETYNITWDSSGVDKVSLLIQNYNYDNVTDFGWSSGWIHLNSNPKTYSFTVPSTASIDDEYKVVVRDSEIDSLFEKQEIDIDRSDNYFSIFHLSIPVIMEIVPSQGQQGDTVEISIKGHNFAGAAYYSGCGISPVSSNGFNLISCHEVSNYEVKATYSISTDAQLGQRNILINVPNKGQSNSLPFNVISGQTSFQEMGSQLASISDILLQLLEQVKELLKE